MKHIFIFKTYSLCKFLIESFNFVAFRIKKIDILIFFILEFRF